MKLNQKSKPGVLGLFSGAGGLDLGFAKAGFDIRVSSDIEANFLKTIERNVGRYFPKNHRSVCADVSIIDPAELGPGPYDFMLGGPPCQSFSAAGRRAGGVHGVNDFRGSLFWHYCRLIEHFAPRGFLFENVRGILQANSGKDWKIILEAFQQLGYTIAYRVLDAADYGVPQHRERMIVVGLKDSSFLFPRPTHGPDSVTKQPLVGVGTAIADLDNPKSVVPPYGGKWGELLDEVPPGMNYSYFTEELGHARPLFAWRSRFSNFLYKLDPKLPSKTIVASQGRYGGPFHWRGRKLTVAEFKRLQTFPDDYEIDGSYLSAVKQIGNSVAPLFAESLARAVMLQVFDSKAEAVELLSSGAILSYDGRKRTKANGTRRKRTSTANIANEQLSLWEDESISQTEDQTHDFEWVYAKPRVRLEKEDSLNGHRFRVQAKYRKSVWSIKIRELEAEQSATLRLKLGFRPNGQRPFSTIKVDLQCSGLNFAAVAWDAVDWCVENCTTFKNIHPLYGHFTEPHPKFNLEVEALDPERVGLANFITKTSTFSYVSGVRPMNELSKMFPRMKPKERVLELREMGWDVRVHETNRAIPQGFFRSCYPFTLSLDEPRFVVWRDKGTDRNADQSAIPQLG